MTPGYSDEERMLLLRELMQTYGLDVLHVVYGYVHDHHQAEDISQEVFIKVFDHLDTFRQDSSYRTWILRIAINTAKDFLRKKARRPEEFNDFPQVATQHTVEGDVLQDVQRQELWEAVSHLPMIYQEVVWLHYGKDLSMDEISKVLDISLSAVKTRLYRGRGILRQTWEGAVDRESSGR
ncbi:MAG: sigma-70 family RNA polymerase sigma factor [Acidibacillus sp.]|uniref:ECF RNA polymerase sigma factor SigW n=1 Tax=Sulfoacidibacillus ferrooxidans TaxID=2005001 RepID=A0A9X1VCU8_9BACL|nr:sigma-70 family RNA polymerase sigma factor [Sulfoacidibacillus ferrooxidans]MCI0183712.1 ECF RNA polymerase sigma factor SigW [Sulfoacidibacillus ferrooxidans]MCY0892248.1 sigma-70 family RNA polymerase sigma factor [Acidibacillus sp.]